MCELQDSSVMKGVQTRGKIPAVKRERQMALECDNRHANMLKVKNSRSNHSSGKKHCMRCHVFCLPWSITFCYVFKIFQQVVRGKIWLELGSTLAVDMLLYTNLIWWTNLKKCKTKSCCNLVQYRSRRQCWKSNVQCAKVNNTSYNYGLMDVRGLNFSGKLSEIFLKTKQFSHQNWSTLVWNC